MRRLKERGKTNKLIKETTHILIRYLKNREIDQLNEIFRELDTEHTGYITASDLQNGLRRVGMNLEDTEVESKYHIRFNKKSRSNGRRSSKLL